MDPSISALQIVQLRHMLNTQWPQPDCATCRDQRLQGNWTGSDITEVKL